MLIRKKAKILIRECPQKSLRKWAKMILFFGRTISRPSPTKQAFANEDFSLFAKASFVGINKLAFQRICKLAF